MNKFIIGVQGIGGGAGATMTAIRIALCLARNVKGVTFLENHIYHAERPCVYNRLILSRKFKRRGFTDVFSVAEKKEAVGNVVNLYKDVNWLVHKPEGMSMVPVSPRELAGKIVVWDTPGADKLSLCNLIIGVMDGMPSVFLAGVSDYDKIRSLDTLKIIWVLNRDNESVDHKEFQRFAEIRPDFYLKEIPRNALCKREYDCDFCIDERDEDENLALLCKKIAEEIRKTQE